jgi:predicted NBD/HSP70 family sugar kinase/transcriptional regulator with XRE-family HTH domain
MMTEHTPADRAKDSPEQDDLAGMLEEIGADPVARAAYEDRRQREELIEALVQARNGRSQKKVAAWMGTTQSAISDIENGRVDPRLSTLQRYARAVGTRLEVTLCDMSGASTAGFAVDEPVLVKAACEVAEDRSLQGVLTDLYRKGPVAGPQSPANVAKRTGLPEPTVGYTMHRLHAAGWLDVVSAPQSREPQFSLSPSRGLMIGMSLSRDRVHAVMTDLRATRVLTQRERALPDTSPEGVTRRIAELVEDLQGETGAGREIVGLGVTLAGRVDGPTGAVHFAPDLQTDRHRWNGVPLQADLESMQINGFGPAEGRVVVENDANALAMHEYLRRGEDQSVAVMLMSESGEGIGGGLVINGAIAHGRGGLSGEIGHVILDPGGESCRCGAGGCLETVASAVAIVKAVNKLAAKPVNSLGQASELVQRGNNAAAEVFTAAGRALGRVLSSVTAIVGPPRLVIFGPPQLTQEPDVASARAFMNGVRGTHANTILDVKVDVEAAVLEETTLPAAAAATAVRHFLRRPRWWMPSIANPVATAGWADVWQRPSYSRMPASR